MNRNATIVILKTRSATVETGRLERIIERCQREMRYLSLKLKEKTKAELGPASERASKARSFSHRKNLVKLLSSQFPSQWPLQGLVFALFLGLPSSWPTNGHHGNVRPVRMSVALRLSRDEDLQHPRELLRNSHGNRTM